MAKKLTISIPDDLHSELEMYRDRIAISSVCAEAIRNKIQEIRKYGLEAKRRFGLLSLKEAMNMAYEKGLAWASQEATLEEVAYLCIGGGIIDEELGQKLSDNYTIFKLQNQYTGFHDLLSERGLVEDLLPEFDEDNEEAQKKRERHWVDLIFAFCDGAGAVWKEIEGEALAKLLC